MHIKQFNEIMKIKRILHNIYSKCTKKKMVYGPLSRIWNWLLTCFCSVSSTCCQTDVTNQAQAGLMMFSTYTDGATFSFRNVEVLAVQLGTFGFGTERYSASTLTQPAQVHTIHLALRKLLPVMNTPGRNYRTERKTQVCLGCLDTCII